MASPGAQSTTWSLQLPAPASGGNFTVRASSVNTSNLVDKGTIDSFTIQPSKGEPNIKLSSPATPPGASFTASSTGFKGGEQVVFTFLGATVATVTAQANGHVPTTTVKVPTTATFGPTTLTLTGQSSGKSTSATIDITNNWTQFGHDASRTAMEPHDPVINASLSIGNGTVLNQSWYYQTAGPLNTSPAVVDGIAYFGDDTGVFTSLIVNAGSPQWTYRTPSNAPIRSSPAFDSSNKTISFGSTDGNLYSLSAAGSLIRTVAIGGNPTSPVADNGKIYIGSDNGHVLDIDDNTGSVIWTDSMAGAVHSAPSYDSSTSTVVTGDDSGAVTAVDSSTGVQKWKFTTWGAVQASPMIYNGVVYVGSADKNFYAIKESTGNMLWKYAAAAPITASAAIYAATSLSFGDQSGTMYLVSTAGNPIYVLTKGFGGKPIVGVSNVQGNTFVETASGLVAMIRIVNTGFIAWSQQTGSTLSTSPAIVDGTVYIGAADGGLYAFTPQGANPLAKPRGLTVTVTDAWSCTTTP